MSFWGCTSNQRIPRVKKVSQLKNSCARAGLRWVADNVLSWPSALYEGKVKSDKILNMIVPLLRWLVVMVFSGALLRQLVF